MKKYLLVQLIVFLFFSATTAQLLAMYTEPYETATAVIRYKQARDFATQKKLSLYVARAYRYECGLYSIHGNLLKQLENIQAAIKVPAVSKEPASLNELA